ncbi:MAG: diguanylate cyclase [Propionivibrio sp.]|nr:diguanylate cyclase [Propionivibrio sp.]
MQEEIDAHDRFMITLEWLMALHERNPEALNFGLINVCFHNRESLGNTYGAKQALDMLCQLAKQLRQAFRKTDLVAREGNDFWILVPYTSPQSVTERVTQLVELASDNGLDIVDRDLAVFNIPNPELLGNTALMTPVRLLEYLKNNRQIAFRWEHASLSS